MNIFVLDENPRVAAQYHCDKHVVKMVLETAQILCTVLHKNGLEVPYKATHLNHPCTLWAGESQDNFLWTKQLGVELGKEYTRRYNKVHKSALVIDSLEIPVTMPNIGLTKFAQAMPEEYYNNDTVAAYREYYKKDKVSIAKWKDGLVPFWWKNEGYREETS